MIDTSAKAMWDELEASRRQNEKFLAARESMIARYTGPFYDCDEKPAQSEPENPAYEWLQTMASQIVAGNPRCAIKPTRADRPAAAMKARALQHAVNRTAAEQKMRTKAMKFFVDGCFGAGVAHVVRKPMPWLDRGPLDGPVHRPVVGRVSPKLWRRDPRATDWEDTRWRGHGAIVSKAALLARAKVEKGWRVDVLNALQTETGLTGFMPKEGENLQGRDDLKVWCVWFPEEQLDPDFTSDAGFWGSIHYYAETTRRGDGNAALEEIRDPQPYYGCREGPYYLYGQMYVPDRLHPLSIMTAIEQTARTMGLVSRTIEDAMRAYARFIINGTGTKSVGMLLKNAKHNGVVDLKGFDQSKAKEFTKGGVDANMIAMYQFMTEVGDKRSGISQTARGNTKSGTTATAETYAAMGGNARVALTRDGFYAFMSDLYGAQAAMIDQDDEFWMPPPPELEGQVPGIQGGREPGERFEDYELNIEPMSMRFRSEEERASAADYEVALFERLSPLAVQYPFLDIPGILLDVADSRGESQLPSRFNEQVAGMIAAMMLQNEMIAGAAYQPGAARPEATMGGDRAATRGLQPPAPMAQLASAAGKPAGGAARAPRTQNGAEGAARSRGAAGGNKARKASYAAEGGRPRGS